MNERIALVENRNTSVLEQNSNYWRINTEFSQSKIQNQVYYRVKDISEPASWQKMESIADKKLKVEFNDLVTIWKIETQFLSSITQKITHPTYAKIVSMGPKAISLIMNEMSDRPSYWFWALELLTGEDPVTEDIIGDVKAMTKVWLDWGKQNGYYPS